MGKSNTDKIDHLAKDPIDRFKFNGKIYIYNKYKQINKINKKFKFSKYK